MTARPLAPSRMTPHSTAFITAVFWVSRKIIIFCRKKIVQKIIKLLLVHAICFTWEAWVTRLLCLLNDDFVWLVAPIGDTSERVGSYLSRKRATLLLWTARLLHLKHVLVQFGLLFELVEVLYQFFDCLGHEEADLIVLEVDIFKEKSVQTLELYQIVLVFGGVRRWGKRLIARFRVMRLDSLHRLSLCDALGVNQYGDKTGTKLKAECVSLKD